MNAPFPPPRAGEGDRTGLAWTDAEITVLETVYPVSGSAGCLPLLPGRDASAIRAKAFRLRLSSGDPHGGRKQPALVSSTEIDRRIEQFYARPRRRGDLKRFARTIGRPSAWVCQRALALGCREPGVTATDWSEEETALLRAMPEKPPAAAARALARKGYRRSPAAVAQRRRKLGEENWRQADVDGYSARELASLIGADQRLVARWIERGWLAASRRGPDRPQGGGEWRISRRAVRRFVIENAAAVNLCRVDKVWFIDLLGGAA